MKTKRPLSLLMAAVMPLLAAAYNVTGTVVDQDGEPLPDAAARLLNASDSAFVKGVMANNAGLFRFADVKSGKYIVETTYVGYRKRFTDVAVKKADVKLGEIRMEEDSHLLAETVVTGVKTPIKVMEDTIEYNADSYKTQPNAVVEDLLKRLPGVEVGTDGKITANGKQVKKILVDGKEFFSDDPQVASKNLPVNMVEKLQVVDRKSDFTRMTGVDDGEEETVINLTVKRGMKNGWFGNAEAGYGTDDRYKAGFNVNRFRDGNQVTLLGNFNNVNQLGFTDGNGARFGRWGGGGGITTTQSAGLNFNVGKEEIIRFGGDVMYSHTDRNSVKKQDRQYLLPQNSYRQNSLSDNRDQGHNVRADFRVEWKPDSFNSFDFRPNFSFNRKDSRSNDFSISEGKNMSLNRDNSTGDSYEAGGQIIYNHNFRQRKGRSFSLSGTYRMTNVREDEESYAYNIFYQFNDSIDSYDQYIDNHTWSNFVQGRFTWTEPIGRVGAGHFLTLSYNAEYRWNNADKLVYNRHFKPSATDFWTYDIDGNIFRVPQPIIYYTAMEFNDSLSNRFRNTNFRQDIRVGYRKVSKNYNLNVGVSLVPQRTQSTNLINDAKSIPARSVLNYAPFLRFRYKFDKSSSVNIDYNGRSSQPSMSQLQPVPDYSNPLNIRVGNPNLLPSFSHNLRLRSQLFNQDAQRSIMTMLKVSTTQNEIITKTIYDVQTGGRTTTYENVSGAWQARLMNMFSQPLRNKLFSFNNNIFFNYGRQIGYNNGERNVSNNYNISESFSFAYRPDNLEIELRPNYTYQTATNSASSVRNTSTHRFGGSLYANYYAPFGLVLSTDFSYSALRGYARGYNDDSWMWNASISYQFLRERNATIQLSAYDLLQQRRDISRSVTAAYIDNSWSNSLSRYFMLTFTYKFNTFGKGGTPELREGAGRRGPGGPYGPGGPGGPGGGRPPRG